VVVESETPEQWQLPLRCVLPRIQLTWERPFKTYVIQVRLNVKER